MCVGTTYTRIIDLKFRFGTVLFSQVQAVIQGLQKQTNYCRELFNSIKITIGERGQDGAGTLRFKIK